MPVAYAAGASIKATKGGFDMRYSLVTVLPLALVLSACGNDSGQQAAAPATPVESSAPAAEATTAGAAAAMASAPVVADESTAAPISDDAVVYDPIDVTRLQSSWWQQFNK